jgi:hypothetical protein
MNSLTPYTIMGNGIIYHLLAVDEHRIDFGAEEHGESMSLYVNNLHLDNTNTTRIAL